MAETIADTRRLISKPQNLNDAYGPPSNFLEIDVGNPQTVGVGRGRFTTYEIRVKTNLPIFKLKESTVRRRYSDFEWLRNELERESKVVVPPLPGKALLRQLPFRGDDGIFDDSFIEERKQALEQFINKWEILSACVMMHVFSNHENLSEDVKTLPEGCRPPTGTERTLSSHVLTR
ncbi:sorting nexin-3 isoform X1 [Strix aluco]|uniref:sorting nexin-3 isoform X1 n=1 Tax=Strix aluco TaxID=111821 RepID=UPI003DA4D47D